VANNYGGSAPGGKRAHRAGLNGRATESTRARPGRCPAAGLTRATRLDFRGLTDRPRRRHGTCSWSTAPDGDWVLVDRRVVVRWVWLRRWTRLDGMR